MTSLAQDAQELMSLHDDDGTWHAAVVRATHLTEPTWPRRMYSRRYFWALGTLALLLYVLDPDVRMDDRELRDAVLPYMDPSAARQLLTELPAGQFDELRDELRTVPSIQEYPDSSALLDPDQRPYLVLAVEVLWAVFRTGSMRHGWRLGDPIELV
ncbi:hypothetical protein ACIBBE_45645 [Streptomyces sp. NPDC051644]|uniref:hypothetical protein n=1 Tax=Streptomyces sp. NPDC051644 TaxID=3365666 RepID=UPI0037B663B5